MVLPPGKRRTDLFKVDDASSTPRVGDPIRLTRGRVIDLIGGDDNLDLGRALAWTPVVDRPTKPEDPGIIPASLAARSAALETAATQALQQILAEDDPVRSELLGLGMRPPGTAAYPGQARAVQKTEALTADIDETMKGLDAQIRDLRARRPDESEQPKTAAAFDAEVHALEILKGRLEIVQRILVHNNEARAALMADYSPRRGNHAHRRSSDESVQGVDAAIRRLDAANLELQQSLQMQTGRAWASLDSFAAHAETTAEQVHQMTELYAAPGGLLSLMKSMGKPIDLYDFSLLFAQEMALVQSGRRHVYLDGERAEYDPARAAALFVEIQRSDQQSLRFSHRAFRWLRAELEKGALTRAEAAHLVRALAAGQLVAGTEGSFRATAGYGRDPTAYSAVIDSKHAETLQQTFDSLWVAKNLLVRASALEEDLDQAETQASKLEADVVAFEERFLRISQSDDLTYSSVKTLRADIDAAAFLPRVDAFEAHARELQDEYAAVGDGIKTFETPDETAMDRLIEAYGPAGDQLDKTLTTAVGLTATAEATLSPLAPRLQTLSEQADAMSDDAHSVVGKVDDLVADELLAEIQRQLKQRIADEKARIDPELLEKMPRGQRYYIDRSLLIGARYGAVDAAGGDEFKYSIYRTNEGTFNVIRSHGGKVKVGVGVKNVATVGAQGSRTVIKTWEFVNARELAMWLNGVRDPARDVVPNDQDMPVYPIVEVKMAGGPFAKVELSKLTGKNPVFTRVKRFSDFFGGLDLSAEYQYAASNVYEPYQWINGDWSYIHPDGEQATKEYHTVRLKVSNGAVTFTAIFEDEESFNMTRKSSQADYFNSSYTIDFNVTELLRMGLASRSALMTALRPWGHRIAGALGYEGEARQQWARDFAERNTKAILDAQEKAAKEKTARRDKWAKPKVSKLDADVIFSLRWVNRGENRRDDVPGDAPHYYYRMRNFFNRRAQTEVEADVGIVYLNHKFGFGEDSMTTSGLQTSLDRDQSYLVNYSVHNPALFFQRLEEHNGDAHTPVFTDNTHLTKTLAGEALTEEEALLAGGVAWVSKLLQLGRVSSLFTVYRHEETTLDGFDGAPLSWKQAEAFLATDRISMLNVPIADGEYFSRGDFERLIEEFQVRYARWHLTYTAFTPALLVEVFEDLNREIDAGHLTEADVYDELIYNRMLMKIRASDLADKHRQYRVGAGFDEWDAIELHKAAWGEP